MKPLFKKAEYALKFMEYNFVAFIKITILLDIIGFFKSNLTLIGFKNDKKGHNKRKYTHKPSIDINHVHLIKKRIVIATDAHKIYTNYDGTLIQFPEIIISSVAMALI